jgi:perosamine synthetase
MDIKEYPVGSIFGQEEIEAIQRVLNSGEPLTRGPDVEMFEGEFAAYCGAKHAIAVSSCGAALNLTSKILNLREGDEVICQVNSFWVTINHLLERKVKIICADIDPYSLNIDVGKVESLITDKTKAIYLVHHGGNPANLNLLRRISKKYGIVVVEDAAHAVGAKYKGRKIGDDSDLACFSFSSLKNISTLGEGGMLVTNNDKFAELARGFRSNFPSGHKVKRNVDSLGNYPKSKNPYLNMGDSLDYDWIRLDEMGSTYRLSTVQAAVGRVQLKKLNSLIQKRTEIAERYNQTINEIEGLKPVEILQGCKHAWHLYSFFVTSDSKINRGELVDKLTNQYNIEVIIRFFPINMNGILKMSGCQQGGCSRCSKLENIERIWFHEQMSLPISPQISDNEMEYIIDSLRKTIIHKKN